MIRHLLLIAVALAAAGLAPAPAGPPVAHAQTNDLSSFHAVDVSPTELRVGVVYSYDGARGPDDIAVTASAIQANGVAVPGLVNDIGRAIVRVGRGRALTVLRMESPGRPRRSMQVEVCLNHRFSGDILCRTFPHVRHWGATAPPTRPEPPPPASPMTPEPPPSTPPTHEPPGRPPTPPPSTNQGTCTVSGRVTGQLVWTTTDTRDGRKVAIRSTLREMVLISAGRQKLTTPINNGAYVFSGVPAGRIYIVDAGRFRSNPSSRRIDCRPHMTFRNADFEITGGPRS